MARVAFDTSKIKTVSVDQVHANSYNPKDDDTKEYRRIVKGIRLKGQRLPVVVREVGDEYEIIDGEQRWKAARELGLGEIIIYNEGEVSDQEARELTLWYQQQVPFNELELAGLLKEMTNWPDLEVPFEPLEMEDILKVLDFDWDDVDKAAPRAAPNEEAIHIMATVEEQGVIMTAINSEVLVRGGSAGAALCRICEEHASVGTKETI